MFVLKSQQILRAVTLLPLFAFTSAQAQTDNSKNNNEGSSKEEGNRNVMLNASSANGPREIQIGLPSADVNVLENGLPVTYATNPHSVNSNWRSDASLSHVGLLKISETAITTGNIGYAVNSFTQLGQEGFHGRLDYKSNHFGLQEFSLNLNGSMGHDWYYSANIYQDFDPGTFNIKLTPFQDRTQIYKAALTKRYNNDRGEFTAIYHYSNSHPVYTFATQSAPFIYVGDGSVKEYGDFKLGTTSYLPTDNNIVYRDIRTGELKQTTLYDTSENHSSEITLMNTYKWDNGLTWKIIGRYDNAHGALVYQSPMSLINVSGNNSYNYVYQGINGKTVPYTGEYVQTRMSCLNGGDIDEIMFTSELSKNFKNSTLRIGINEWYYKIDYASNTTMYDQSVPSDGSFAVRLYDANKHDYYFYDFNKNASEYYNGHENKLALYITHDWNITPRINVYYGGRIEWQTLNGENAAVFTYQKPTYKKYETSVTFSDGTVGSIKATGNIVAEIPQVLIEIDPSYMITKDLKIWTSFRYFSKTYANINEAYYFNSHWETFGGVNWQVNKKLSLGCTVVNFLNQTGAKGSIAGAELITKDEARQYNGHLMTGSYLRPFTV